MLLSPEKTIKKQGKVGSIHVYPTLPNHFQREERQALSLFALPHISHIFFNFIFFLQYGAKVQKKNTERHPENAPILMGNLEEDASSGVILQVDATNELSNQEH
jgi:hypothetical protein